MITISGVTRRGGGFPHSWKTWMTHIWCEESIVHSSEARKRFLHLVFVKMSTIFVRQISHKFSKLDFSSRFAIVLHLEVGTFSRCKKSQNFQAQKDKEKGQYVAKISCLEASLNQYKEAYARDQEELRSLRSHSHIKLEDVS